MDSAFPAGATMDVPTPRERRDRSDATVRGLPVLAVEQRAALDPALLDIVEYRKSGLSLNWIVGCPLNCGYCVRHLFGNFTMKVPRALTDVATAFERLVTHPFFAPHRTPIQLLNRATD